jgi:hypothetical protein
MTAGPAEKLKMRFTFTFDLNHDERDGRETDR